MGKSILIIDDEGLVTKSLQIMLAKEGFNAVVASSGKEAIEKLKNSAVVSFCVYDICANQHPSFNRRAQRGDGG